MARFHCPLPLHLGAELELPEGAARHVQVLRLQPGDSVTLFDGQDAREWQAQITHMGRRQVQVRIESVQEAPREGRTQVHLAVGMPANERMDWLVEKATELGVASIQPLLTERSVLRLQGERAEKKVLHWQSVAVAASEQCGGNRVPTIHGVQSLGAWLAGTPATGRRLLLSLAAGSQPLPTRLLAMPTHSATVLCGPEGGLSAAEESAALQQAFEPTLLGPRVLRTETAALAALGLLVF